MSSTSDAWQNLEARRLLSDLADRGIVVTVRAGGLDVRPASLLTPKDVSAIKANKGDVMVLVLGMDDRTFERMSAIQQTRPAPPVATPGVCRQCADALPHDRRYGLCGWCHLAAWHVFRQQIPAAVLLAYFDEDVRGRMVSPAQTLLYDMAVPA